MDLADWTAKPIKLKLDEEDDFRLRRYAEIYALKPEELVRQIVEKWLNDR